MFLNSLTNNSDWEMPIHAVTQCSLKISDLISTIKLKINKFLELAWSPQDLACDIWEMALDFELAAIFNCLPPSSKSTLKVYSQILASLLMPHWLYMLTILSDSIINQTIGSSVQINRSLQLCFRFLVCYQFATKSVQNNQNLKFSADPSHKIWE